MRIGSAAAGQGWARLGDLTVGRILVDRAVSAGGASEGDNRPQDRDDAAI